MAAPAIAGLSCGLSLRDSELAASPLGSNDMVDRRAFEWASETGPPR
jgi:hypothetical protein